MAWSETRLKFLAEGRISNGLGEAADFDNPDWPRYIRTTDIAGPRTLRDDTFASLPPDVASAAPVRAGDILMSAAGTVGKTLLYTAPTPACYAGYLVRFRPSREVDPRFIAYWTETPAFLDQVEVGKVRSTIDNFSASKYANLRLSVPELTRQRRIADYLDAETSRIEALIETKQAVIGLLRERLDGLFAVALDKRGFEWGATLDDPSLKPLPVGWRVGHLSVILDQLTNGYVGPTRDLLVDEGVRYIQSLHIKEGVIDFDRRPFYVPEKWHQERPRIHLRPSDVLIVQTGDIGQVAVVPPDFGVASCHALQIARVRQSIVTGEYLAAYLRSPFGRQSLLSRATGALHPHLEAGIRDVPVVIPPLPEQHRIVSEIAAETQRVESASTLLREQIGLLTEHRTAVITAVVSGDRGLGGAP